MKISHMLIGGLVSVFSFVAVPSLAQTENYCKIGNSLSVRCLTIKAQAEQSALQLQDWIDGVRSGPKPHQHICVEDSPIIQSGYSVAVNCVLTLSGEKPSTKYKPWALPRGKTVEQLRRELGIK